MKEIEEDFAFLLNLDKSDDEEEVLDPALQADAQEQKGEQRERKKQRVEIAPVDNGLNELKKQTIRHQFPLIEEYDFQRDSKNPDLKIDLKPNTVVRDYQE